MRKLDLRYLTLGESQRAKDYFSFVLTHALASRPLVSGERAVEIGCACGDFANALKKSRPSLSVTAVDMRNDLITRARALFPGINFRQADLWSPPHDIRGAYDLLFMLTVHSLYDDISGVLDASLQWLRPNGDAFVFGLFNPVPLDVTVRVREAVPGAVAQKGWNIFSKETVSSYLHSRGYRHNFYDYSPPWPKVSDDEGRFSSWTQQLADGRLQLLNGAQIIHTFSLLHVEPSSTT